MIILCIKLHNGINNISESTQNISLTRAFATAGVQKKFSSAFEGVEKLDF